MCASLADNTFLNSELNSTVGFSGIFLAGLRVTEPSFTVYKSDCTKQSCQISSQAEQINFTYQALLETAMSEQSYTGEHAMYENH
jgi:hypothetical protein